MNFILPYKIVVINSCLLTVQENKELELTSGEDLITTGNKLDPESVSV